MNRLDDATKRQIDELSFELSGQIDSVDTGLGNQSSEGVKLTLAVMGLMASRLSRGDRDVARRLSDFYAEGFDHPEGFEQTLGQAKAYAGNVAARDRILNTISSVIIADGRIGDAVREKYHQVALALGGTVESADEQMERSVNRYL